MNFTKEQQEWLKGFEELFNDENEAELEWEYNEEHNDIYFTISFYAPNDGNEEISFWGNNLNIDYGNMESLDNIFRTWDQSEWIDDYVRSWLNAKENGTSGIPSAIELTEDAEELARLFNEYHDRIARYSFNNPYKEVFVKEQTQEREL